MTLQKFYGEQEEKLAVVQTELKPFKEIRYWVDKVLTPEQKVEKKLEPKYSMTEKMDYYKKQVKEKQIQKELREKKQNREL